MDVQTFLKKLKLQVPENVRATAQQYERLLAMKSAAKRSKVCCRSTTKSSRETALPSCAARDTYMML